ncbi:MAG: peptidoglycan DD-metalloendopeptidase family protein [Burkholderiales bacterium]|nr:MAG: peptidoglycan DD-metalloendopeptidase family protein [Burkholderiales bacterium]
MAVRQGEAMSRRKSGIGSLTLTTAVLLALGACGSVPPAPVVSRTTPSGKAPEQANFYTVVRGDTLYGIAIRNGVTVSDLRRWNGLSPEDLLQAGNVLRVTAPPEAVAVKPPPAPVPAPAPRPSTVIVIPPPGPAPQTGTVTGRVIDTRPLDQGTPVTATEASGPLGVKQPYSEQAYEQLVKADPDAGGPPPGARPAPGPVPAPTPAPGPGPTDARAPVSASGWSWPAGGPVIKGFSGTSGKGIEIAGRVGDPVYAAAPGRVIFAGVGPRGYGNLIIIKHDEDVLSVYAHNSKVLVKEGQDVGRGQRVADVGDSDSDRPKLHFEVRRGGRPVDPTGYLPKR